jgi:hypothetical protein
MNDATMNDIVNPSTGEVVPSTITFQQAYQTYKNFVSDNRERNSKNAAIARKLNGEQPWNPRKLKASGQSWRSNRPTGFMSSLMKRLMPPYKQIVDQLPLLTYSHFPEKSIGSEAQQDVFRKGITDCIRNWSGWSDFITQLIDEDIGYGYAAVGREDEFSWKPKLHRSDEAMFYVGCPQQAEKVKIWGLKQDYFVDEITEILRDFEVAASAGWRVDNLVKKLNTAGKQFDDRANEANSRVYEDLIRENNLASSFTSSIRVVKAGHIFALNPAGGIDHYIFDRDDGTALFFRRSRYDKMTECLTLFSAEIGDRTLHGSRGAGRALYNTHVSIEQARNLVQDALHLSGLLLMKRTTKVGSGVLESPGLTVVHPFAVVGDGFEVLEKVKFNIDAEAFFNLDKHATTLAEIQVGAFMPGQVQQSGQARTASEVNYVASIDAQIRAGVLARFADQMFELIDEIQKRICNSETVEYANTVAEQIKNIGKVPIYDLSLFNKMTELGIDKDFVYIDLPEYIESDAFDCVLKMINEGLSPSQIIILANSKSRSNVDDAIASQSGLIDTVMARYAVDPIIDTVELKRRDIASKLGADAANRLMNVDLSPMSQVKQQRQQILELSSIMNGQEVPVDISDDDMIHLKTIMDRMAPMLQGGQIPYELSKGFMNGAFAHAQQHIQSATQKGVKPGDLKQFQTMIDEAMKMIQQPTTEAAATEAMQPVMSGGAMPATEVAVDPMAAATPQDIISSVANPTRPQPPRNL